MQSLRRAVVAIELFANSILAKLNRPTERALAIGGVLALHALFVLVLIAGMTSRPAKTPEVTLALVGGPLGQASETPKPLDLAQPEDIEPPIIDIQTAAAIANTLTFAPGSPTVTRPAMAIAEAHGFPTLPALTRAINPSPYVSSCPSRKTVRLLRLRSRSRAASQYWTVSQSTG